ncbi:signal recognition particle-docking protein FtsY [Marinobacter sp.]|uniref:signal recognition particle-docking protein FtsY n=1 Tax=Marinobacter sp. TaxID=50741 RepID=UPI0034A163C1
MTAEWIAIGLLALLVFVFVLDLAGNRRRVPRPKPVPQKKPEPQPGAEPLEKQAAPAPTAEAPAKPEPQPEPRPEPEPEPEPQPESQPEPVAEAPQVSVFERIRQGLGKTRASLTGGMSDLFAVGKKIDEELLEEIETTLLMADVGVTATSEIIDSLTDKLKRNQLKDGDALRKALRNELQGLLKDVTRPLELDATKQPYVILMVGVNGVGKTTTIGKLTRKFQTEGKSVMLAAGDTFRAAAVEQLQVWGERNDVPVVAQQSGADSASVIFDAIQSAQSREVDVVIADTAGRLQNKDNLMSELEKVVRVMKKLDDTAPHEVMLVLDAGTGQNALSQAQVFQQAVGVSGITLTKLDGTAKGGIVFAIARQLQLPIRFIGVGEQVDDLRSFDAETFVDALFDDQ